MTKFIFSKVDDAIDEVTSDGLLDFIAFAVSDFNGAGSTMSLDGEDLLLFAFHEDGLRAKLARLLDDSDKIDLTISAEGHAWIQVNAHRFNNALVPARLTVLRELYVSARVELNLGNNVPDWRAETNVKN